MSAAEIDASAAEVAEFIEQLATTLANGEPDERKAALRRCVNQISVEAKLGTATLRVRELPTVGMPSGDERGHELTIEVQRRL